MRVLLCMLLFCGFVPGLVSAQDMFDRSVKPADAMPAQYLPLLKGKRVGLIINQTSAKGGQSLLDLLVASKVKVVRIFVPEHGFRGTEDAGAHIDNTTDSATGLPVVSLYGNHKQPTAAELEDVDVLVYDLQDVGVRFYTYISTLQYCMEACAQSGKKMIVLDRPNPNGFYVDGPVLEAANRSFVGMQQIPVVYGMTAGEYALMLKGERWCEQCAKLDIKVVKCSNYTHAKKYELPVAPSPNLRTMAAVYAYPSLCLFEGTVVSVGRGTAMPFQQFGCPEFEGKYAYSFTPLSSPGAKHPPFENKLCYGVVAGKTPEEVLQKTGSRFYINWVAEACQAYPQQDKFLTPFFTKLAGTETLQQQIKAGTKSEAIWQSWQPQVKAFKKIRKKYLLYKDFE